MTSDRTTRVEHDAAKGGADIAPSRTAQQLADALRARVSVESRLAEEDSGEDYARLQELGDLESLPPMAKPGPTAFAVRGIRGVLRAFLRPWLAAQTIFNRESARRFHTVVTTVRDLERRTPNLEEALHHLENRVLEVERAGRGSPATAGESSTSEPAVDPSQALAHMFVHGRLPPPPGSVLCIGSAAARMAHDLESFGYDVTLVSEAEGRVASLAGGWFHVVIRLAGSNDDTGEPPPDGLMRDAERLLVAGGRLLCTTSGGNRGLQRLSSWRTSGAASVSVAEILVAISEGGSTRVRAALDSDDSNESVTLLMIDARRS